MRTVHAPAGSASAAARGPGGWGQRGHAPPGAGGRPAACRPPSNTGRGGWEAGRCRAGSTGHRSAWWPCNGNRNARETAGASSGALRAGRELVLEPVARAVDGEDLALMQQAVEDGRSQHVVAEELAPAVEGHVAGDDERAARIAGRDQLKEQVGA